MLRLRSPTGSIEALPEQEARLRALSNGQLLRELCRPDSDPFAVAEALDRRLLLPTPTGCRLDLVALGATRA